MMSQQRQPCAPHCLSEIMGAVGVRQSGEHQAEVAPIQSRDSVGEVDEGAGRRVLQLTSESSARGRELTGALIGHVE